jgi:hypothetical protein
VPVLTHEIHPSTVMPAGYRHGCFNREVNYGYRAPNGYTQFITAGETRYAQVKFAYIPHTMSRECRFDHSLTDPACAGCKWQGSGEAYSATIRGEGK